MRIPVRPLLAAAIPLLTLPAASAQEPQHSLLFTVMQREQKLGGCGGPSLQTLLRQDVCTITPWANPPANAEVIAPLHAFWTFAGDEDGDGYYVPGLLTSRVDALLRLRCDPGANNHHVRTGYFSPEINLQNAVSGSVFRSGDVGRILRDGQFDFFITAVQIKQALGIVEPVAQINTDAITVYQHGENPDIYLSLENAHMMQLAGWAAPALVQDGAIVRIPGSQLAWAGCNVAGVPTPNIGQLVAREVDVDAWVANSMLRDHNANPVVVVVDTDGLTVDPAGGFFQNQYGVFPNLMFSGAALRANAVLTSFGGGNVAVLNGRPLASTAQTLGDLMGMQPPAGEEGGSINGLQVRPAEPCRYVLDSPQSYVPAAAMLNFDVGGAPAANAYLFLAAGAVGAGGVTPFLPFPGAAGSRCLQEIAMPILAAPAYLAFPMPAGGCTSMALPYAGGIPAGVTAVLQSLTIVAGGVETSTPITLQF